MATTPNNHDNALTRGVHASPGSEPSELNPMDSEVRFFCRVRTTMSSFNPSSMGARTSKAQGTCKQCGGWAELVLGDCVCANCLDRLDRHWARTTATDWILVAPHHGPSIMQLLKASLGMALGKPILPDGEESSEAEQEEPDIEPPCRYIGRDTTYAEMRSQWAAGEPGRLASVGRAGRHDIAELESRWAPWPSFLRPATAEEIAAHDKALRSR